MGRCQAKTKSSDRCENKVQEGSDYCHIDSHCDENAKEYNLNPKQRKFCDLYVSKEFFANGTQSYIEAYNKEIETKSDYRAAKAAASRLLTNVNVCDYINEQLEEIGLNDNFVDKELLFLINQHSDFKTKLGAIKEYNKVKGRITNKHDIKSGGEKVQGLTFNVVEQ